MSKTVEVFFFPNGNTAVCENNQQVPELQEPWILLFAQFLEDKGVDILTSTFNLPYPGTRPARFFRCEDGRLSWKFGGE